jgi:hypothetical protein
MKSNCAIDFDIFEGFSPDVHSSVRTKEELLCKVEEMQKCLSNIYNVLN